MTAFLLWMLTSRRRYEFWKGCGSGSSASHDVFPHPELSLQKRITVTKTNTMKSLITVNVGVILIFEKCPTADRVCGCSAWNVYKFYCVTCTLNSSLTLRKITICDKNSCSWLLIKVVLSLPSKRRIETFLFSGSGSSTNSSAKFHRSGFGSRKVSWK